MEQMTEMVNIWGEEIVTLGARKSKLGNIWRQGRHRKDRGQEMVAGIKVQKRQIQHTVETRYV